MSFNCCLCIQWWCPTSKCFQSGIGPGIKESDTGLATPALWDLAADKQAMTTEEPLQVRTYVRTSVLFLVDMVEGGVRGGEGVYIPVYSSWWTQWGGEGRGCTYLCTLPGGHSGEGRGEGEGTLPGEHNEGWGG